MKDVFFYIDPESYANLSAYDYNLLSNVKGDVIYFCSSMYDHVPMKEHITSIPLFTYNKKKNNLLKGLSYIASYFQIFVYILRMKPKAIHIQWLRLQTFDLCFYQLVAWLTNVRLILTAHNVLPLDSGTRYVKLYRHIYHLMDRIISHTENSRNELIELFNLPPEKVVVIPHGLLKVNINEQQLIQNTPQFEKTYPLQGRLVFSSLGFQTTYKGADLLAKVWSTTPELNQNPNCMLVIAGKFVNVDLSSLESFTNVVLQNRRISNEELYHILTHTDVYLLPYREISQSGAMLTAITERIPLLVTNVGGLAEPLSIAKVGWCIDADDEQQLRDQLLYFTHHTKEVIAIKNNSEAWSRVQEYYGWEHIGKRTLQVYNE